MVNIEMLDKVQAHINAHPHLHEQDVYMRGELAVDYDPFAEPNLCGTTACIAGWATIIGGWHQVRPFKFNPFSGIQYDFVVDETGREVTMDTAGAEVLELSVDQSMELFAAGVARDALNEMMNALRNDPNADLEGMRYECYD